MNWLPKKKVVVPVDFAEESANALSASLEFVENPADVHVVHVLIPVDTMSPGVIWGNVNDETRKKAVRRYMDEFLSKHEVSGVTMVVRHGNPGLEICDYAIDIGADLIVISSHGYHGVRRMLMGSVAERVLRHADCPVLVLRRTDAE